jgi:hypothetical protein
VQRPHRAIGSGTGHDLPHAAPEAIAQAIYEVDGCWKEEKGMSTQTWRDRAARTLGVAAADLPIEGTLPPF